MSLFARIDAQLASFATVQHARFTRNRDGESLRAWANNPGFEERRIDWQRDGVNLAVIIQPDFGSMVVDTSKWHFIALAWEYTDGGRRVAERRLVNGRPFPEIEARVDELLAAARAFLNGLQVSDLQLRMFR